MIQSSCLMVSSGNNNVLTCTNGNVKCMGNIKVLKFYLVVGAYVDEMGWDRDRGKTRLI